MHREAGSSVIEGAERQPDAQPQARALAMGRDWRVSEYLCRSGPADRPFEERHESFTIAAVVSGIFLYRADSGRALLQPGALLLGNFGTCFECGHDHSYGDHCIALHLAPEYFAEIAATAAGDGRFTFPNAMLPALPQLLPPIATFQARAETGDRLRVEETVVGLAEAVVAVISGKGLSRTSVTARDERRISRALHLIEAHSADPIDIDALAGVAAMSKYHFLRCFRRSVGVTPYQYLLGVRMRRVAADLARSDAPVSTIAFEAGFGDPALQLRASKSPNAKGRWYYLVLQAAEPPVLVTCAWSYSTTRL